MAGKYLWERLEDMDYYNFGLGLDQNGLYYTLFSNWKAYTFMLGLLMQFIHQKSTHSLFIFSHSTSISPSFILA